MLSGSRSPIRSIIPIYTMLFKKKIYNMKRGYESCVSVVGPGFIPPNCYSSS
uniref:Uncharacterized protein n=1 Tax=Solanum lycopersicum TaxID=4081 RepID=A0A3Q7HVC3_SOLLC